MVAERGKMSQRIRVLQGKAPSQVLQPPNLSPKRILIMLNDSVGCIIYLQFILQI